jgi:hypothetical protein
MSTATIPKFAFAFPRDVYKDRVWEFVWGAVGEYFKAEIAKANGFMAPVDGWEEEVENLIDQTLPKWLEITGTKGRFDRAKAIEESIRLVESQTNSKWTQAVNKIAKYLKVSPKKLKLPNRQDIEATYFLRVRANCDAVLEQM